MQKKPMIRYLSYIYDKRANEGVSCTMVMLQIEFKKRHDDIKKDIDLAIDIGLVDVNRKFNYVLTREGEKYVENNRYGKNENGINQQ